MIYNPDIHNRRSIRLQGYDYSTQGSYFITICCKNREHLFGEIVKNNMNLNKAGYMIKKTRLDLPNRFLNIKLDEFIIMPNHFHGIIIIDNFSEIKKNTVVKNTNVVGADPCGRPICFVAKKRVEINPTPTNGQFEKLKKSSICSIIGAFKSISTNEYIRLVKHGELPDFEKAIRQRNFFENIIRNDRQLENIREYIIRNPEKWSEDSLFS